MGPLPFYSSKSAFWTFSDPDIANIFGMTYGLSAMAFTMA